ncbi:DUF3237 domain-containing protein [Kushneria sp. AK178]
MKRPALLLITTLLAMTSTSAFSGDKAPNRDNRPTRKNPDRDYARSVLSFEAPIDSPYEWMNKSIFLGTVERGPNFENDPSVIIRVWEVL